MRRMKRGALFLCPVFLFICQTCCISLEILQRTDPHRDKKSESVRPGTITFGRGDGPTSPSRSLEYSGKDTANNGSVDIQSDAPSAGLVGGQGYLTSSEAAWSRLRPKVLCTNDLMKFSAQGPGSSLLQLNRGGTPFPLNRLTRECGSSVYKTLLGLVLTTLYDGCDVIRRENDYLLSLLWQGNQVNLSCPISPIPKSTLAPTTKADLSSTTPPQQQWFQPFPPYGLHFNPFMHVHTPPQTTTAAPTTKATTAASVPQQWMQGLYPFAHYYNPFMHVHTPTQTTTAAPTTKATTAASVPQQWMQGLYPFAHYYNPFMHVHTPPQTTTAAPTTGATSTAASVPQQWMQGIYPFAHYYYPFMHVHKPPQTTTAAPITEATTAASVLQQWMQGIYPFAHYYNPFMHVHTPPQTTTAAPTTEATSTAAEIPQQWIQGLYPFAHYYNPFIHVYTPTETTTTPAPATEPTSTQVNSTEATTTEAASTAAGFSDQQQWVEWFYPYGNQ